MEKKTARGVAERGKELLRYATPFYPVGTCTKLSFRLRDRAAGVPGDGAFSVLRFPVRAVNVFFFGGTLDSREDFKRDSFPPGAIGERAVLVFRNGRSIFFLSKWEFVSEGAVL